MKPLREQLLKALSTRFESTPMDKNVLLATAVDPRFKLKFLESGSQIVMIRETNRLKPTEDECTPVVAPDVQEKTPQAQSHDDLWACFDEIVNDNNEAEEQLNDDVTSEISAFLALNSVTTTSLLSICMVV